MKPLYPAIFNESQARHLAWAELPENQVFYNHLLNSCRSFPSLILAYSAAEGLPDLAATIAESLLSAGINIFLPGEPAPVCSLAQALISRNMPHSLYLDRVANDSVLTLSLLASHGGPLDEKDILAATPDAPPPRAGLAGSTELGRYYVNNLAGLVDRFIEAGPGFKNIEIPFAGIEQSLREMPELGIIFESDPQGPTARVSRDGQGLQIIGRDNRVVEADEIAGDIARYLVAERLASGTIIGPASQVSDFSTGCETLGVAGTSFDMSYHAGFSDLLVGWWNDGVLAHQGSSCFGDAILTAIYYLEAHRSKKA
ncbi:MAG: hypothetical protein CVV42_20265 [Candidatus Riflebacteria bacterium HGW-Riflebacteria-2]|jgi:hypothetical protein|nr:MAG: hypothetical protein CVV42_20265 [Candidatus Riflebacteria bacterium HGW-Riflebacteria-2]